MNNTPGPGDSATWPTVITSRNDPDFEEWKVTCDDCGGTGLEGADVDRPEDQDEVLCFTCEGLGTFMQTNIGLRRRK